jgi:hypothetical protein
MDRRAFRVALLRGALAFVIVFVAAEAIAFLFPTGEAANLSALDTARIGGFLFAAFHHVGIGVDPPPISLGALGEGIPGGPGENPFGPFGSIDVEGSLALAMLLGTALAVWLLMRAGRQSAVVGGGSIAARLGAGALAAVPYAALSLASALLSGFNFEVPPEAAPVFEAGTRISLGPSAAAAALWPLLLGGIAGALGGLSTARAQLLEQTRGPEALAVLGGARRMLVVAAAVGGLTLLVLSAANPSVFVEYFKGVGEAGVRGGFLLLLFTALLVPNFMVLLVFLGMGSGLVAGDYIGTSAARILALHAFPKGVGGLEGLDAPAGAGLPLGPGALPFETGLAPPEWWVAILIPLAAVLWGGAWAARRLAATGVRAAALGALAGAVFAVALVGLAVLAGIGFRVELSFGLQQTSLARLGPSLLGGTGLALLWGAGGGALGGLLGARRERDEA